MSRLKDRYPASFRGFKFLVESENTSRGQKLALHEYVNSDERYAEPLGKIPPILGLNCIIHGEDYFQKRREFERLLEIEGLGELIHPFYGVVQVQAGPFSASSNQKRIGEFVLNVTFYTSKSEIGPTPLPDTPSTISNLADLSRFYLDNALETAYLDPENGADLTKIVDNELDVLDSIQDGIDSVVDPIQSGLSTVRSTIGDFRNKITRIMQTGVEFKASIKNVFNDMIQLTLDPAALKIAWEKLIDFNLGPTGNTSLIENIDTVKRNLNETNKSITDEHTRINGLVGLMESLAYTEFATASDLTNSTLITDERFSSYFEKNEQSVPSLADDQDLRTSVLKLRASLKSVLDDQLANIWRTTEINPGRSSMSLTAYRYYGSLDVIGNIIDLNQDNVAVANFNEEITAITK